MKTYNDYSENDKDAFHDVVINAYSSYNDSSEPTDAQLSIIYNQLPNSIKYIAEQWGLSDIVFRDSVYEYLTDDLKDNRPYE